MKLVFLIVSSVSLAAPDFPKFAGLYIWLNLETAADPPHPYLPSYSLNLLIYSLTLPKLVNLQVTLRLFGQVCFLRSIY